MVGTVEIENNNVRNFKDLRGMRRNAKSLKRNNKAHKGILIAPLKLPRFSRSVRFQRCAILTQGSRPGVGFGPNFAARMASRRHSERTRLLSICRIHSHYSTGA